MSRLSVQLYSLRAIPTLEGRLALVRDAGLGFVEPAAGDLADPDLPDLLARFGLAAPSGHVGLPRLRDDLDATAALAQRLGMGLVVVWGLPEEERPADAPGWRAAGAELGGLARRLAETGLRFAFHNHDWELGESEGACGLDHLFAGAGDAPLLWQADLAWLARGGADVPAVVDAHAARLASIHLKDLAPAGTASDEDGWADLGAGTLPWAQWLRRLRPIGPDPRVLEHDQPADPVRFLRRSIAAATRLDSR